MVRIVVLPLSLWLLASCGQNDKTPVLPRVTEGSLICGQPAASIHDIQGEDLMSPAVGQKMEVEGILTARFTTGLKGFFIATESGLEDQNEATSEGLFIGLDDELPALKNNARIRLRGRVAELGQAPETQTALVEVTDIIACGEGVPVPAVSIVAPPKTLGAWEQLENQWLYLPGPVLITGNYRLLQAGELSVSFDGRDFSPTELSLPGSESSAIEEANRRTRLILDDGELSEYPKRLRHLPESVSNTAPWRVGSEISGIEGMLEQRDGEWRLQLIRPIAKVKQAPRPQFSPVANSNFHIASFNVLNFFNGDGQGGGFPTERGAQSYVQYERQRDKIVTALSLLGADVVALMEIENDGFDKDSAIAQLVAALNQKLGKEKGDYAFVHASDEKVGSDQITVGMIYRQSRVETAGKPALLQVEPFISRGRVPLAQSFNAKGTLFTVVANHFKSKGGCREAKAADSDQEDGQGCWNATRVEMATALAEWLRTNPTGVDSKNLLVVGDLNSYGQEDPVRLLTTQGLIDLFVKFNVAPAYSYIYQGESGRLDHVLATAEFATLVSGVEVWHINADESPAFEYGAFSENSRGAVGRFRPDAYRSSDHDPVSIGLNLR